MLDSVLGFGVLGFLGTMAWLGIRQLQHDQYRREAEYWQHECAMLEYENRFLHGLEQWLIPRLLNRFGADMQDFMIDRELVRLNETAHPKQAGHITVQMYDPSRASKGIDITAGNFVGKEGADEADEWDSETEYADCRPTDAHRQPFEQISNTTGGNADMRQMATQNRRYQCVVTAQAVFRRSAGRATTLLMPILSKSHPVISDRLTTACCKTAPSPIHAKAAGRKNTPPPPNGRLPTAQGGQPEIPTQKTAKKPESGQNFPATDSGFFVCYETAKPRYETHAGHDKTVTKPCYETKISF